jgi:hypothetical protein
MIDEKRLTRALKFLAESDEECAALQAEMEEAKFKAEVVRETVFVHLDGSVADRAAHAKISQPHQEAMTKYFSLYRAYKAKANKRGTESIIVDTWRSLNASRRQGNI